MKKLFFFLLTLSSLFNKVNGQDGNIDLSFSGDGQYGFMPFPNDVITSAIVEVDGDIYAFLSSVNSGTDAFVLKMNEDGSPETNFGVNGLLTIEEAGLYDAALSLDETEIYIVGRTGASLAVAALSLSGDFTQPWTVVGDTEIGGFAKIKVDSQGRIYVGTGGYINEESHGVVLRLGQDFLPDTNYGDNGVAVTASIFWQYPLLEIDHLDRAVLVSSGPSGADIERFTVSGDVDATFNYTLDFTSYQLVNWILDFAIAGDNSIYVQPNTYAYPNKLFKILESGSIDPAFASGGVMTIEDNSPNEFIVPDELLSEPGGGLIVMGTAFDSNVYMTGKYLLRLDENGVVDPLFNSEIQPIDDNGFDLRINFHCSVLQHDGKVLAMDQVVKWQNGQLLGYVPLITRFNNEGGAIPDAVVELSDNDPYFLFPNPAHDVLNIRRNDPATSSNDILIICDNNGAQVLQQKLGAGSIDVSSLASGLYQCMIISENKIFNARVIRR